jgi:hypothetical protein
MAPIPSEADGWKQCRPDRHKYLANNADQAVGGSIDTYRLSAKLGSNEYAVCEDAEWVTSSP